MKKTTFTLLAILCFTFIYSTSEAQCSICNKTVQQMGSKPAKGFNTGILYLMAVPYAAVGFIGYKWWKSQHESE